MPEYRLGVFDTIGGAVATVWEESPNRHQTNSYTSSDFV
jgi:hypothetical protein